MRFNSVITLVVAGTLALAGCGSNNEAGESPTETTTTAETATTAPPTTATTATTAPVAWNCASMADTAVVNAALGASYGAPKESIGSPVDLRCSFSTPSTGSFTLVAFAYDTDPAAFKQTPSKFAAGSTDAEFGTFAGYTVASIAGFDTAYSAVPPKLGFDTPNIVLAAKSRHVVKVISTTASVDQETALAKKLLN
jgi:hypothetical protein